jgi:PIN domain nuclease of toxin-antitoxin system
MGYILDTHVILWLFGETENLSNKAKLIIENPEIECCCSTISLIEISIKKNIGKLDFNLTLSELEIGMSKIGINIIPVNSKRLDSYVKLPIMPEHKDPFDRMIIATAIAENLSIITIDHKFDFYSDLVDIVW